MKTTEQKLQHVMEAAGECWHNFESHAAETMGHYYWKCSKCPEQHDFTNLMVNPSPDDLKELFRLAKKIINISYLKFDFYKEYLAGCYLNGNIHITVVDEYAEGKDEAEALLNALFIATGGKP